MQTVISQNLSNILSQISQATKHVDRPHGAVSLVAVSKKQKPELMNAYHEAAKEIGIPVCFGENYVQEYKSKLPLLTPGYEVHLIGPLQSNKVREAVKLFDLIQSVHSLKIVELVIKEASKANKRQRVLLQVNISSDDKKSGFLPTEISEVLSKYKDAPSIQIEGCMTITALYEDIANTRKDFRALSTLVNEVFTKEHGIPNSVISMGMSSDFELAIEEGSTMVRIGTALFGERPSE
jgi:pyridoxal phosphate enzyme (YggS family)